MKSIARRSRLFSSQRTGRGYLSQRQIHLEPLERRELLTAVMTDLQDYAPGATAKIFASGFQSGETVEFQVVHTDGTPNTGGGHDPWSIQDGSAADLDGIVNGNIATTWYVNPDDSNGASFLLTSLGLDSGLSASHTFTDAGSTLSQFANKPTTSYQTGSLNGSNSAYVEGNSIPFRYLVSGVKENGQVILDIIYQFQSSAAGPRTYDFLTNDTASETITDTERFGASNASKPAGFALASSANLLLVPIPDDAGIVTDTGGFFRVTSNLPVSLVSVTAPAISSSPDEKHIVLTLQIGNDGDATPNEAIADVGVFWGGHLARDTDYAGVDNGASDAPGASFHMRVEGFLDLNGNGIKESGEDNLGGGDRSIQGGVVVHTSLAWEKRRSDTNALLGGATFTISPNPFTGSGSLALTDNGPGDADPDAGQIQLDDILFRTYTITETTAPTGFSIDPDPTRTQTVTSGAPTAVVGTQNIIDLGTTDESDFFNSPFASQIAINKTTVDGATSGDALTILAGESIGWRYSVTNPGNVPLSNVTVTDNQPGVTPVYQSGDANYNNQLDVGEIWVFVAAGTAQIGSYSNIGTANGTDPANTPASATDGSSYFGADPQIAIDKVTVDGASSGDGKTILNGEAISWRYTVTNVGNVVLSSVAVTDNQVGVTPAYVSGDTNNNSKLDLTETWVYSASGTAVADNYSNTGTAKGTFTDSATHSRTDTATDTSTYFGADPQIAINKITVDGASSGDGNTILTGEAISWRYSVTNAGNVALSGVTVSDNQVGVTPTYVSGDTNGNSKLDLTETWIYSASGTAVTGDYSNTGTALGGFTDTAGHLRTDTATDTSAYFGADPQITINKVTVDGASSGDGNSILTGEAISWRYTITNVGNVALSSVAVTDNQVGVTPVYVSGDINNNSKLDLTETWVYSANGTAVTGNYSNTGTAKGTFTDTATHSRTDTATDTSSYFGADPQIAINKVTVDGASSGDGNTILTGEAISWRYTVTNVGNVALSSLAVTDNQVGVAPAYVSGDTNNNSKLDLTETWVYSASGTAVAGNYSNTGTANGTFSDIAGHARTDTATDASSYFGADPQIAINKVTVDGASSGDGTTILTGEAISWRYTVTNVGNVALSSVAVTDNQVGVTPAYASGDTNNNSKLDLTETWVYSASGTAVTGNYNNTGTGQGSFTDTAGHLRTDTATDASSYFGADPQIAIDKVTVNGLDAGDGLSIPVGTAISWQYTVTNSGNVPLSGVTVTDNQAGVTPAYVSGDTNNSSKLDLTETWVYSASGTAVAGNYSNTGTAKGTFTDTATHSRTDTATDPSSYFGTSPMINLNKVTVDGATSGDGITILSGEAIGWRYTVTNSGNVPLSGVTVTDNKPGVTPIYQNGDANNNGLLESNETWVYLATGTAQTGNYSNIGTATATDPNATVATATDPSSYFGADPQIAINKVTVDGASSGDGNTILTGEAISWRYTVTNTGNVALSGVTVTDNQVGVTPAYVSGDTNSNSKLDLTETWVYSAGGNAVTGNYSNTGTANGSFTDTAGHLRTDTATDTSSYFGADPQIAIDKVTVDGASSGDGNTILTGEAISWRYTVTNAGNVALSSVAVTDNQAGVTPAYVSGDTNNNSKLDLTETWVYAANGTAVTGTYSNTGTAKGAFTDTATHSRTDTATDSSSYFGADPQIAIDKVTVNGLNSGDGLSIPVGTAISWRYTVTNSGNVPLSGVTVTDNQAGVTPTYVSGDTNNNSKLDLTETWVYAANGTAIAGNYSNTGTAKGTFTDAATHSRTDTATDTSSYFGASPMINLNKVTVDGATSGDGITILTGEAISWRYTVTNSGNVPLSGVTVTDNKPGVTPSYQSGDANNNALLESTETWVYVAAGTAQTGNYSNIGTVTATDLNATVATATDSSSYFGADPQIAINKVTVDGASSGDGNSILTGEAISWRYTVTNVGNVALSSVTVTDNQVGVTPAYVSGDTNNNSKLDLTETWVYAASGTSVTGNYSNTGTAKGTFTDTATHSRTDTAADSSSYFGADPQIAIDKVTVNGLNSGDGLSIPAGAAISWRYTVTNGGNVPLSGVTVTDNQAGVTPAYVSGDTNNNSKLDLTESWIYSATGTAVAGNYSNTGTAKGTFTDTATHSRTDTATDTSSYFGASPMLNLNKVTVDGATSGDGITILTGEAIGWRYTVTNSGNVPLSGVTVTDNKPGVTPIYQSGDTNNNSKLDLTETWVYAAAGTAQTGNYSNIGTVTATDPNATVASATDASSYFGADPQIAIDKVTVDGASSGDGKTILTGEAISWRYTVTNVGNVALSGVTVTDNQVGVTPAYVSGDTNNNSKLDLTETWVYAASGTAVTGDYSNTGTAKGTFTDAATHSRTDTATDTSSYFGANPQIAIEKQVSVDNGVTWIDADVAPGPTVLAGLPVQFRVIVTNTGNVPLSNVTVTDTTFTFSGVVTNLAVGASDNSNVLVTTAIIGQHQNTATANGSFSDTAGHSRTASQSDLAHYFGRRDIIVIAPDKQNTSDSQVKLVDKNTGAIIKQFYAYEQNFMGGVRLATGDMNGDGVDEIITAPGRGRAPEIRVFMQDGVELTQFRTMAYATTFVGGVQVDVGDVNGDGKKDIVTAPSSGATQIRIFHNSYNSAVPNADPIPNLPSKEFNVYSTSFLGGADIAVADMGQFSNGVTLSATTPDGKAEVIVGNGAGMRSTVYVYDVSGTPAVVDTVLPGTNTYTGGVTLDAGRINADAIPDLIVAAGNSGGSMIELWSGVVNDNPDVKLASFATFANTTTPNMPVRATWTDSTGDGIADSIVVVQGTDGASNQIRSFSTSGVLQGTLTGFTGSWNISAIRNQAPAAPVAAPLAAMFMAPSTTASVQATPSATSPVATTAKSTAPASQPIAAIQRAVTLASSQAASKAKLVSPLAADFIYAVLGNAVAKK